MGMSDWGTVMLVLTLVAGVHLYQEKVEGQPVKAAVKVLAFLIGIPLWLFVSCAMIVGGQ